MVDWKTRMPRRPRLGLGAAVLVALGAAGGAGATAMTRPSVEMAPASPVAIASLPQRQGIVTVRGRVAETYGDRFVVADGSGRTMVDAGHGATGARVGAPIAVQGRFDDGQLHASFVVDGSGTVSVVGPGRPPRPPHGPGGPGHDGPPPPPPPGGPGAPPPPPLAGCAPGAAPGAVPPALGAMPPPVAGAAPAAAMPPR